MLPDDVISSSSTPLLLNKGSSAVYALQPKRYNVKLSFCLLRIRNISRPIGEMKDILLWKGTIQLILKSHLRVSGNYYLTIVNIFCLIKDPVIATCRARLRWNVVFAYCIHYRFKVKGIRFVLRISLLSQLFLSFYTFLSIRYVSSFIQSQITIINA